MMYTILSALAILAATVVMVSPSKRNSARQLRLYLRAVVKILSFRAKSEYTRVRSEYYWLHRSTLPRVLRCPVDFVMGVDSSNSKVDTPTKTSESVSIDSCIASNNGMSVELLSYVRGLLPMLDAPGSGDKLCICLADGIDDYFGYNNEPCTLDILYKGHSNPSKKIPAKTYFVRYNVSEGEVVQFPPYGALERQRKGFGVNKIKSAFTVGPSASDVTKVSQIFAGPRNNFYVDCADESVAKEFIGIEEDADVVMSGRNGGKKLRIPGHFFYTHLVSDTNVERRSDII